MSDKMGYIMFLSRKQINFRNKYLELCMRQCIEIAWKLSVHCNFSISATVHRPKHLQIVLILFWTHGITLPRLANKMAAIIFQLFNWLIFVQFTLAPRPFRSKSFRIRRFPTKSPLCERFPWKNPQFIVSYLYCGLSLHSPITPTNPNLLNAN